MAIASQVVKKKKAGRPSTQKYDINSVEGLAGYARSVGLNKEADKATTTPKLSMWQRLGRGLNAFEIGNAAYKNRYEKASFLKTYGTDIAKGLGSAITGRDYLKEPKRTFKDIMVKEGMKDRPGKLDAVDVTGLAADILTDPTTFLGGYIGKGVAKGVKGVAKASTKLPVIGKPLKAVGEGIETAFNPLTKVKKMKGGEKYADEFLKEVKGIRASANDYIEAVSASYKTAKKTLSKKEFAVFGKKVAEGIESGNKTGIKLIDEAIDSFKYQSRVVGKELADRGIIKGELPDWVHHMVTPEWSAMMKDGGAFFGVSESALPQKFFSRGIEGSIQEINEWAVKKYGIKMFEEDAFKAFAKSGVESIAALRKYDFAQRVAKQFGDNVPHGTLVDGVKFVKPGGKLGKIVGDTALPEPIVEHMTKISGMFDKDESLTGFLKMYDKVLQFWKGSVTGYFPSFHTRNATGGIFNNWIAGVNDPTVYTDANKILGGGTHTLKAGGKALNEKQLIILAKERGVLGQTGIMDAPEMLMKNVDPSIGQRVSSIPQKAMGAIEDRVRLPLFLHQLKKGLQKGLDVETAADLAGKKVIKYHFDYMPEGFTQFERNFMKRIIPFYTWTRHNIPLQIEQLIMQPGKYAGIFKAQRAWGVKPTSEEEQVLPRWLRERFTIKEEGGYWSGIGLPIEEATEKLSAPFRGLGVSLSPLIKTPIEKLTGYNIFKEKKIEDDYYGKFYKNAPEPIKNYLQLREVVSKDGTTYYYVNPERRYWLELIGARGVNTGIRLTNYVDDPKNLLALITTIRKYDYDIEDMKQWSDSDKRRELEKALEEVGALKTFERAYIPKTTTQE